MSFRIRITLAAALCWFSATAFSQTVPGTAALSDIASNPPRVDLEITTFALRLLSSTIRTADPEVAGILDGLDNVHLRIFDLSAQDDSLLATFESTSDQLVNAEWQQIVAFRDKHVAAQILMLQEGGDVTDTAIFYNDATQAAVVTVSGLVEIAQLGAVISELLAGGESSGLLGSVAALLDQITPTDP